MSALIISVGTTTRTLADANGAPVDHDVPDLQLVGGHVDPPLATRHHIAYFASGGSMMLTPIEPGLWWAVASARVDIVAELGHLGAAVKTLHEALVDSEAAPGPPFALADKLAGHPSGMWTEELEVEGDDTTGVVGIRGPGMAGMRARSVALSGQDLGDERSLKAPAPVHARRARRIVTAVEVL